MRKKVLQIFIITLFAQIFLYACCTDINNIFLSTIDFTVRDAGDTDITTVTNEDFSLLAKADYDRELNASLLKPSNFINMAYAVSCDEEFVITKPVSDITLTANVPLFGVDAGNPLNNHVRVGYTVVAGDTAFTLNDMIQALNYEQTNRSEDYFLTFDTLIPIDTTVIFTLIISFENGEQLQRVSSAITFIES
jgi:hypothetical protein